MRCQAIHTAGKFFVRNPISDGALPAVIHLEDVNGDLTVSANNGPIAVKNHRGDLTLFDRNGPVSIASTCQNIEVTLKNGPLRCALSSAGALSGTIATRMGPVALKLGDEVSTNLDCSTTRGVVSTKRDLETTVKGPRVLRAKIGDGEGELTVRTQNGPITIA